MILYMPKVAFIIAVTCACYFGCVGSSFRDAGPVSWIDTVKHSSCFEHAAIERTFAKSSIPLQCIIMRLNITEKGVSEGGAGIRPARSSVRVSSKPSYPKSQAWSRCIDCGLVRARSDLQRPARGGGLEVKMFVDNESSEAPFVDASWSQWSSVFVPYHKDYYAMSGSDLKDKLFSESESVMYIDRPVFILPVIELHVGHIIVDLLEQLFDAMMTAYGTVRRDALIVIDFGKRRDVQTLLLETIYGSNSTHILSVLRRFTDLPVLSVGTLRDVLVDAEGSRDSGSRMIIVRDLHVGLDISHSSYNVGSRYHPMPVRRDDSALMRALSDRYVRFQSWLSAEVLRDESISEGDASFSGVLVVQHKGNRLITNLEEVVARLREVTGLEPLVVDLDDIPYPRQLHLLRRTRVLVGVAGTALHNMLFMMQRPAAVIALMQPGWCERAWVYVNQAAMLGIEAIVACAEDFDRSTSINSTTLSYVDNQYLVDFYTFRWLDGPFSTKFDNIDVHAIKNISAAFDKSEKTSPFAIFEESDRHGSKWVLRSGSRGRPYSNLMELYAFNVTTFQRHEIGYYSYLLALELLYRASMRPVYDLLHSTHTSLCVCFQVYGVAEYSDFAFEKQCLRQSHIDAFAQLNITISAPHAFVHLWLQTSKNGFIIDKSDLFLPLISPSSEYYDLQIMLFSVDRLAKMISDHPLSVSFQFKENSDAHIFAMNAEKFSKSYPKHFLQQSIRELICDNFGSKADLSMWANYMTKILYEYAHMVYNV